MSSGGTPHSRTDGVVDTGRSEILNESTLPTWTLWIDECQAMGREMAAIAVTVVSTKNSEHFTRGSRVHVALFDREPNASFSAKFGPSFYGHEAVCSASHDPFAVWKAATVFEGASSDSMLNLAMNLDITQARV